MPRINLIANDDNEKIMLDYLEANASDFLADRINTGSKTLNQCWNYIKSKAKEKAIEGCACIDDKTVFGWGIHFFEEDSINGLEFNKFRIGAVVKTSKAEESKADALDSRKNVKPKQKAPINNVDQISFDFLGGN